MKVKQAAKIIIFCVVFLLLLNRIYDIFSWKDTAGEYYSSMNSFYELEDSVVDVLFLGSSHCYCSVNPAQLWEEYGMGSFNMAISGQDLASTYYNFKEALKTQDLKVVCVDLYGCTFQGYGVEGNLYRNLLSRKLSLTYLEAVNSIAEKDNRSDFIFKWPIVHTRYRELGKGDFLTKRPTYLGYSAGFNATPVAKNDFLDAEPVPFEQAEQEWITKIIELAQESGTELVFFVAPYQAGQRAQENISYAKLMAGQHDVPVIDMIELSDELGLDWEKDFVDFGHTNHFGAQKVTAYLGKYLKENYALEDHRGDERYALWDEDLKVRKHEVQNYELTQMVDPDLYFETVSNLEDYTVIVSTTGDYISGEKTIDQQLQVLGVFEEFNVSSGVWVFDNGERIFYSGEANMLHTLDLTYGELVVGSSEGVKNIIVDRAGYKKVENGINILVYDNLNGRVVDSVGFDAMYAYGMAR